MTGWKKYIWKQLFLRGKSLWSLCL